MEQSVNRRLLLQAANCDEKSYKGLLIALGIIATWAVNLIGSLFLDLSSVHLLNIVLAVAVQMFLYTGLFITAHDAMHRSLFPANYRVNDFLGSLCVSLYACFSYQQLLKNHWLHHRFPATAHDPDYHDGESCHPILWFYTFIKRYYSWFQFLVINVVHAIAHYLFKIPEANLILFWAVPALLSAVQLFYFGTFLPHREPQEGYTTIHRARSNSLSTFWSFLSCYHFGYHEEHHEYPSVPWWQLPIIRKLRMQAVPAEPLAVEPLAVEQPVR